MTKFSDKHMAGSPVKQIAKERVGRLRARAQRRSERSGETSGYDYEDPKVLKLLNKASRIEKRNKILDSGFVKGKKTKGSEFGEDPRIGESYERPDADSRSGVNYGSPLKGAYAAGGGGGKYKSILPHIQQLNAAVSQNVRQILEDRKDPEKEAERLQNRVERRQNRKDKRSQTKEFISKTDEIIKRQDQKQQRADKKQKDPCFDEKTGKMKDPGTTAINSRGRIEYC